jgi:hypothetical protein
MMNWYVGPYLWSDAADVDGGWALPKGAKSCIDLRSVGQSAERGRRNGDTSGRVVIASQLSRAEIGGDYSLVCSGGMNEPITRKAARKISRKASAGTLADAIRVALIDDADPAGDAATKPLMPGRGRKLKLACGGLCVDSTLVLSGRGWMNTLDVIRRDMDELIAQVEAGTVSEEHSRKCLDYAFRKLRLKGDEWKELLSKKARRDFRGPLPHSTTVTESFNQSDSSTLGPDLSWTETSGDLETVGNECARVGANGFGEARAEADVSGSDHVSQVVCKYVTSDVNNIRTLARFSPSVRTMYMGISGSTGPTEGLRLGKRISGTFSELGAYSGSAAGIGDVVDCTCDGSTIEVSLNGGTPEHSVTDTSITGNTRGGVAIGGNGILDDYQLADIAVSGIVYTQLERNVRGMNRGIWLGGIG